MKTLYSTFVVFFCSIIFGQYTPMLQTDNAWSQSLFIMYIGEGQMHYDDYDYRFSNNTLNFNDKEFFGMEYRFRYRIGSQPQSEWSEWQDAPFYLHENIAEKKFTFIILKTKLSIHLVNFYCMISIWKLVT